MMGKKPDELIREPFLWDTKAKDKSRTTWRTPQYSTDQAVAPVTAQVKDKNSILNHYKSFIKLRNQSKALTFGSVELVAVEQPSISAFVRTHENQSLLVLHNLSKDAVTLTLPEAVIGYSKTYFKTKGAKASKRTVTLPAYSSLVLEK
jgi:alpha-amylase